MALPNDTQSSSAVPNRVLLVEDDEFASRAFHRSLSASGYHVDAARTGAQALEWLGERRYDAIVSDIDVPGLNGVELLRKTRAQGLRTPFILATGAPALDTAVSAVEFGAFRYLQKPVRGPELVHSLQAALREAEDELALRRRTTSVDVAKADRSADEIVDALESLRLRYEPIVSLATGRLHGVDARIPCGAGGVGSPELLRSIEDSATFASVLADQLRTILERVDVGVPVFVAVPPSLLEEASSRAFLRKLYPYAHRIVLQPVISRARPPRAGLKRHVDSLRRAGFRFSVAGLGAGFAQLRALVELMPDVVKLDRTLVQDLEISVVKQEVIKSMVRFCDEIGAECIAEGGETEFELATLERVGVKLAQGPAVGWTAVTSAL